MTTTPTESHEFRINPISTNVKFVEDLDRQRSNSAKPKLYSIKKHSFSPIKKSSKHDISDSVRQSITEASPPIGISKNGRTLTENMNQTPSKSIKPPSSTRNIIVDNPNERAFKTTKASFNLEGVKPRTVYDWPLGNKSRNVYSANNSPEKLSNKSPLKMNSEELAYQKLAHQIKLEEERMIKIKQNQIEKIKEEVFEEYKAAHQEFVQNVKILDKVVQEIDINYEGITNKIAERKLAEIQAKIALRNGSESDNRLDFDLYNYEVSRETLNLEKIIISETDELIKHRLKHRGIRQKLKKHDIEEFGMSMTLFFRKIMTRMFDNGDIDSALMLNSLNKMLAIELEDLWINYTMQLNQMKKNPHQELLEERAQDKFTIEQQKYLIKKKQDDNALFVGILQKQLERAFDEKKRLEEMLKEKILESNLVHEKQVTVYQLKDDGNYEAMTEEDILNKQKERANKLQKMQADAENQEDEN